MLAKQRGYLEYSQQERQIGLTTVFYYASLNVTATTENDNRKKNKFATFKNANKRSLPLLVKILGIHPLGKNQCNVTVIQVRIPNRKHSEQFPFH